MLKKRNKITTYVAPMIYVVRDNKDLSALDRLLLLIMMQLSYDEGFCFASNRHLAAAVNSTPGTVSNSINKMQKLGYIVANVPDSKRRIFRRVIWKDLFLKPNHLIEYMNDKYSKGNNTSCYTLKKRPKRI